MAAEQPWMVAQGVSPGNVADDPGKLRSSDVGPRLNLRRCSAAQAFRVPMTCGFTAGYLTPLLRSESQADHYSAVTPAIAGQFACGNSCFRRMTKRYGCAGPP